MNTIVFNLADTQYPARLRQRLGSAAPPELTALGNPAFLSQPMTALFCSARCPGGTILSAYDQAAHWRDTGRCVISGFHSSVEKECLRILLRGSQPVIICPARSIPTRPPPEWRAPMSEGRLLLLSFFKDGPRRPTTETAQRRNTLVAALADDVYPLRLARRPPSTPAPGDKALGDPCHPPAAPPRTRHAPAVGGVCAFRNRSANPRASVPFSALA